MSISQIEWLALGMAHGFCGEPVCASHESLYDSDELDDYWDGGDDICLFVVRLATAAH